MTRRRITIFAAAKAALFLLAIGSLCGLSAAGSAIGMAMTNGNFRVDHSRVWGNSTLFDGSLIETARAGSQVQLNNGVKMRLGAETRATIFQGKLVLEEGQGEMAAGHGFEVEAKSLRIAGASEDAMARVRVGDGRHVLVAAVRGSLSVSNAAGMMIARIAPGEALNFEPQAAGATAATQASGCLLSKGGKFILVDRTTNVVLELQGADLAAQAGNRVEITGRAETAKPQVADASQVIDVAAVKLVAKGGCTAVAKKVGASTAVAAGAGAAAGAGVGAAAAGAAGAGAAGAAAAGAGAAAAGIGVGTVAVIGGVATTATVGGLAAAGELPGQGDPPPSTSR
jgi:hypothetical protein